MATARVERRLAAILAADVVGYSRLMEKDEAGTFARLKRLRQELVEPVLEHHGGRFVDLKGDGAIVEFGSAVAAVEAADPRPPQRPRPSLTSLQFLSANRCLSSMYRWVQRFAPELEKRTRRHLRPCRGPWHVDETYLRVDGEWRYLYRAVDGTGQTIDFLLSAKRDKQAAKRFFRKALGRDNTRNPRTIVTDRLKSYPGALREMKREGELWRFTRHRRGRWLNNLVEQDHRRIKRRTGPMLGFQSFWTARRTLAGVEAMAMLAKGQVRAVPATDMPAQRAFVHQVFGLAA